MGVWMMRVKFRSGSQTHDDETWTDWWILPGSVLRGMSPQSRELAIRDFIEEHVPYQTGAVGNPGGEYRGREVIRRTRSGTVVITQSGGYDV